MTSPTYRRLGVTEGLRSLLRAVDFLCVLAWLRLRGAMRSPRRYVLVEFGPGPTRLASLKRTLFKEVHFLDVRDFGIVDPSLRVLDLERLANERIQSLIPPTHGTPLFLFADHCLEHLSNAAAAAFFEQVASSPHWACCARVPNVLSRAGAHNFRADPTHHTSFAPDTRTELTRLGFAITPWFRFYRLAPMLEALSRRSALLGCEEVALIKATHKAPGAAGAPSSIRRP